MRWDCTKVSPPREEDDLLSEITSMWINVFGPMSILTLDEETGMGGRAASDWSSTHNIQQYKAPRQKAWIVERHNELLR
eukprot:8157761-Karenia_brevis.AAC.1